MFQRVCSAGIWGIEGILVSVEADIHDGLPGFTMTGNLSQETREAQERVRTALKNGDFRLPVKKITVNLSPADLRKDGAYYDLAVAAAVLGAFGVFDGTLLKDSMVAGELGLNGEVKPVRGTLSLVSAAKKGKLKRCYLPAENALEGSMIEGIEIIPVENIRDFVSMLTWPEKIRPVKRQGWEALTKEGDEGYDVDFSELNGQAVVRRATEVAVAGRHNILYIGTAGSGKTMAARRIPTILPAPDREESIEISKIYSICGLLPPEVPLMTRRPFRSPHHTITPTALAGGGTVPRPGEISLASGGVLFLDELPEFSPKVIEILRQPLEDRSVTVSRLHGSYVFPANVMLAAAMNVETVILIQTTYDKKTEMPQNQGILLIFYVIKVTIKDNWSYFQIKKKGESAPVFNDRKVIVIKMYLSLQGKISIGVAVTSTKQYIFAIRRGPKYKI